MTELNEIQRNKLKKTLLGRRVELEKLMVNAEAGSKPVSLDQPIGRLSRMDAMQQQSMSQASRRAAAQRLEQVNVALQRINTGRYGRCVGCDDEIDYARLQARPETPFCIDCQGERERRN